MFKAKTDHWTMSYKNKSHSWTCTKEYNIKFSKDGVHVESDKNIDNIPWECCNSDLFYDVFGINLSEEKSKFNVI
ncbi:MAG: hypothetical protein ACI4PR_06050 [Acutalibacteraceae bacterium]